MATPMLIPLIFLEIVSALIAAAGRPLYSTLLLRFLDDHAKDLAIPEGRIDDVVAIARLHLDSNDIVLATILLVVALARNVLVFGLLPQNGHVLFAVVCLFLLIALAVLLIWFLEKLMNADPGHYKEGTEFSWSWGPIQHTFTHGKSYIVIRVIKIALTAGAVSIGVTTLILLSR